MMNLELKKLIYQNIYKILDNGLTRYLFLKTKNHSWEEMVQFMFNFNTGPKDKNKCSRINNFHKNQILINSLKQNTNNTFPKEL